MTEQVENLGNLTVTRSNYTRLNFMGRWKLTHVDGEHRIEVLPPSHRRADEPQFHIEWDHGLYADEDGDQWSEAHVIALMMRAAPQMLTALFKLQQFRAKNGPGTPLPAELWREIDEAVQHAQTEDDDEIETCCD